MAVISFPYGKGTLSHDFENENLRCVSVSALNSFKAPANAEKTVENALRSPVNSEPLCSLAKGKRKVVLIASDHTRPVPSRIIVPQMLSEIRKGNPDAQITILVATGCHRETTRQELAEKFGGKILKEEKIVIHDCADTDNLVCIGTLPSGGPCVINRLAAEADLLVSEGFIEPHFFAGYSGGRKSVLPGICSRETVLANHCSEFIDSPFARTGVLKGNPIHADMIWAAKKAGLAFIVNVVINSAKEVLYAVAGEPESAHEKGCDFLSELCLVNAPVSDIVITSNGGYPMDQNIYQSVKGMTAAEAAVKKDGVIIMLAAASDGHGGENFFSQMASEEDTDKTLSLFRSRKRSMTVPDQWQSQVFIRVLKKARVIYISDAPDCTVEKLHMIPAHSVGEALECAKKILKKDFPSITAIPDGISVVVNP